MKRIKKEYRDKTMTGNKLRHSFNTNEIKPEEYPFYEKMGFDYIFEDYYQKPFYQEQVEHIDLGKDEPDYKSKKKKSNKRKSK